MSLTPGRPRPTATILVGVARENDIRHFCVNRNTLEVNELVIENKRLAVSSVCNLVKLLGHQLSTKKDGIPSAEIRLHTTRMPPLYIGMTPKKWRRERDSNPRYGFKPYTRLAGEHLRPLGHLSVLSIILVHLQKIKRASIFRRRCDVTVSTGPPLISTGRIVGRIRAAGQAHTMISSAMILVSVLAKRAFSRRLRRGRRMS